jgi:hypothetical protein
MLVKYTSRGKCALDSNATLTTTADVQLRKHPFHYIMRRLGLKHSGETGAKYTLLRENREVTPVHGERRAGGGGGASILVCTVGQFLATNLGSPLPSSSSTVPHANLYLFNDSFLSISFHIINAGETASSNPRKEDTPSRTHVTSLSTRRPRALSPPQTKGQSGRGLQVIGVAGEISLTDHCDWLLKVTTETTQWGGVAQSV